MRLINAMIAIMLIAGAVIPADVASDFPGRKAAPVLAGIHPLVYIVGVPVIVVGCYNLVTGMLAGNADRPRDPDTGVIDGAGAIEMGPGDAQGAALLVHGFVGSVRDFDGLPEELAARGWHVRAMRLPGHGTRPQDLEEETAESLIDAVLAEYDSLHRRYGKVVLVGHSMGGTLAVLAASERQPDALVLAAPYFGVTNKWYYGFTPETWAQLLNPFIRWVYKGRMFIQLNRRDAVPNIISYHWIPLDGVEALSELRDRALREEVLDSIDCQVLVIHSRHDDAASPGKSRDVFEALPSAGKRFVWLERSNHLIFWDYDRDRVIDEIVSFLGSPE